MMWSSCFVSFLVIRRPPCSTLTHTLFPNAALFRSGRLRRPERGAVRPICASRGGAATRRRGVRPCARALRRRRGSSALFQRQRARINLVTIEPEAFGDRLCRLRDGLVGHRLAQRGLAGGVGGRFVCHGKRKRGV